MAARGEHAEQALRARVDLVDRAEVNVATGLPVLDHLLGSLARYGAFGLALEVAPGDPQEEVAAAGRALGQALRDPVRADGVPGHGSALVPAEEALAQVALEAAERPLVVSNVDLSEAHVGGLGSDLLAGFLHEVAEGAGLNLHVRLVEGRETEHVLETIFRGLGVALAQACRPRP